MMLENLVDIDWGNVREAVPAFLTVAIMPLTYSIAYGVSEQGLHGNQMCGTDDYSEQTTEVFGLCSSQLANTGSANHMYSGWYSILTPMPWYQQTLL